MARRTKQSNKLARSNAAHARLARNKKKDWITRNYHESVLTDQKRFGRILSPTQKKALWNLSLNDWNNRW